MASQVKVIVNKIAFLGVFGNVIFLLLNLLPYVSIWALLTMLYLIMPNTKIPLRSAIVEEFLQGRLPKLSNGYTLNSRLGWQVTAPFTGASLPCLFSWVCFK